MLCNILSQAILFATDSIGAERALIVYEGWGLVTGLDAPTLWVTGEISTSLLQSLIEEGEPMVMIDASMDERTRDQTSAILSALRSALFVPLRNPEGGLSGFFYADHRGRAGALDREQLTRAERFVTETLGPQLHAAFPEDCGAPLDWDALTETRWL
jgi:hypothetical protein